MLSEKNQPEDTVTQAFGQKNRLRLIEKYFQSPVKDLVSTNSAWKHVYRMLLWVDQVTGLAHCYESDKSQPGKPWYARSLAFHKWLSDSLNVKPSEICDNIDWMFQRAAMELAAEVLIRQASLKKVAEKQLFPYNGKGFPVPGDDPELVSIIKEVLGEHLNNEPSAEKWRKLVQRIRQYLTLDNKRKNLLGEGFEDVLAAVIKKSCPSIATGVYTRQLLHNLPGFNRVRRGEKPNKVDLSVIRPKMRILITAKWSIRADREKQFGADFGDYVNAESDSEPFEYVLITNEFDPARLMRACEKLAVNAPMFTQVIHINTEALRATYGNGKEKSMCKVIEYIDSGRLMSLENWLNSLFSVSLSNKL